MPTTAVQSGHLITVTAPTNGYTSGALVELTDMVGVAEDTAASGVSVNLHTSGVFDITKVAATTNDFTQGDSVYVTSGGLITNVRTGNQFVGIAWAAAASSDTTVTTNINFGVANGGAT